MDIQEYNGCETYFHCTTAWNCERIAQQARNVGRVELVGRPMGDHEAERQGARWEEYADWGKGIAYGMGYHNRDNAWEYAGVAGGSSYKDGAMFVLGWDGKTYIEVEDEGDEIVVPLGAYEVIAVITLDGEKEIIHEPMAWAKGE